MPTDDNDETLFYTFWPGLDMKEISNVEKLTQGNRAVREFIQKLRISFPMHHAKIPYPKFLEYSKKHPEVLLCFLQAMDETWTCYKNGEANTFTDGSAMREFYGLSAKFMVVQRMV